MQNNRFWPLASHYPIHVLALPPAKTFDPAQRQLMQNVIHHANAARALQDLPQTQNADLRATLHQQMSDDLAQLAETFDDTDTQTALKLRAECLADASLKPQCTATIAQLYEQELVCTAGLMSTWVGKSTQEYESAFFAKPNAELQRISDGIDHHMPEALAYLKAQVDPHLITTAVCTYRITDLIAIGGEANQFPKHFAYFLPEDEGVKYAHEKRTIVFANTYQALFEKISLNYLDKTTLAQHLPHSDKFIHYLIAWFRGHDIGHSIIRPETSFGQMSRIDRWASMSIQECLADVFGLLMCQTPAIKEALSLTEEEMVSVYMLELLRYLRRGPCDFPDASSAFIQLLYLIEKGTVRLSVTGEVDVHMPSFITTMTSLAQTLSHCVLTNDEASITAFIKHYCPRHNASQVRDIMLSLGISNETLDYYQPLMEETLTMEEALT